MDLVSIARTVWRHKLATLPVLILTFIGIVYVLVLKPPVYQATSSYILISPPGPPTADQVAKDPALGRVSSNNPYVAFGDLNVVAEVVTQAMGTDQIRSALVKEGVDPRYSVGPSTDLTTDAPILQVTGVGSTPAAAVRSATFVGVEIGDRLNRMQAAQGVDSRYWIKALQLTAPAHAQMQVSGKLRSLIAILAVGVILLFVVVSTMKGLAERRAVSSTPGEEAARVPRTWTDPRPARINVEREPPRALLFEQRARR